MLTLAWSVCLYKVLCAVHPRGLYADLGMKCVRPGDAVVLRHTCLLIQRMWCSAVHRQPMSSTVSWGVVLVTPTSMTSAAGTEEEVHRLNMALTVTVHNVHSDLLLYTLAKRIQLFR